MSEPRICASCPSRVLMGREYCFACRQFRTRQQAAEQRRKSGQRVRPPSDYPPHVIEMKYHAARLEKRPWERARIERDARGGV